MPTPPRSPASSLQAPPSITWRPRTQWAVLFVSSALLGAIFQVLHMPAALMLGPMVAGIVLSARGGSVRLPPSAFLYGQGVIGCFIAESMPLNLAGQMWKA